MIVFGFKDNAGAEGRTTVNPADGMGTDNTQVGDMNITFKMNLATDKPFLQITMTDGSNRVMQQTIDPIGKDAIFEVLDCSES